MIEQPQRPMTVDFRRLNYFVAVCDHGGISMAAAAIGMAQPALTRQIQLLEKELGLKLFKRAGRGAEPTDVARTLLSRIKPNLLSIEATLLDVQQVVPGTKGQIVIGICPTIAPLFLPELKAFLNENNSELLLSVIEAFSGDIRSMLDGDKLDLALTYKSSGESAFTQIELFSEQLVLVSAFGHEPDSRKVPLGHLENLQLVLPSRGHELRSIIDSVCKRKGIYLRPELELDSLDAIKSMVKSTPQNYRTILPVLALQEDLQAKVLSYAAFDSAEMSRTICVALPQNPRSVAATQLLTEWIKRRAHDIQLSKQGMWNTGMLNTGQPKLLVDAA